MSMYLSISTTIADMEDAYGTASDDVRLERIAGQEPLPRRVAGVLRRTGEALLATATTLEQPRGTAWGRRVARAA